jgi:hypothetical protein
MNQHLDDKMKAKDDSFAMESQQYSTSSPLKGPKSYFPQG